MWTRKPLSVYSACFFEYPIIRQRDTAIERVLRLSMSRIADFVLLKSNQFSNEKQQVFPPTISYNDIPGREVTRDHQPNTQQQRPQAFLAMSQSMIGSLYPPLLTRVSGLLVGSAAWHNEPFREGNQWFILETTFFFGSIHGYPNVMDTPVSLQRTSTFAKFLGYPDVHCKPFTTNFQRWTHKNLTWRNRPWQVKTPRLEHRGTHVALVILVPKRFRPRHRAKMAKCPHDQLLTDQRGAPGVPFWPIRLWSLQWRRSIWGCYCAPNI